MDNTPAWIAIGFLLVGFLVIFSLGIRPVLKELRVMLTKESNSVDKPDWFSLALTVTALVCLGELALAIFQLLDALI